MQVQRKGRPDLAHIRLYFIRLRECSVTSTRDSMTWRCFMANEVSARVHEGEYDGGKWRFTHTTRSGTSLAAFTQKPMAKSSSGRMCELTISVTFSPNVGVVLTMR